MEEESEEPSCMIGVSGKFLGDIQVEARSQWSTDATQTEVLCAYTLGCVLSLFLLLT